MTNLYRKFYNSYLRLIIYAVAFLLFGLKLLIYPEMIPDIYVRLMGLVVLTECFTTLQQIYIKYLLKKNQNLKNKIDENNRNMSCSGIKQNHAGMRQTNIYDV